jgi:putative zinc-binding metallo-peptidase
VGLTPSSPPCAVPGIADDGDRAGRLTRRPLPPSVWEDWDDERLLDLRLCDLDLGIAGSELETRINELERELQERGLGFRPHYWLSDEWFCPDGVPGIAIPFYLAHPRLVKLELHQMLEVEGGTRDWGLKILRHETGHAIENAYRLRQRPKRQQLFGRSSVQYPEHYTPRPYSRSFVVHLEAWYAQSHPDEDFAETFAVWLTPNSDWKRRYQGWPALRKLEYVDQVMRQIGSRPPAVDSQARADELKTLRKTLRVHYQRKRAHYGVDKDDFHDRALRRLFSDAPQYASHPLAARFLSRIRRQVRQRVRRWTHEHLYTIDQVLKDMIARSRELGLHLTAPEHETEMEFTALLTVQTLNYLHSGRHRLPL